MKELFDPSFCKKIFGALKTQFMLLLQTIS